MDNFEKELKLKGLNLTKQEVIRLQKIAIKEFQKSKVMPILKRENFYHYYVLSIAFLRAAHELMFMIYENPKLKHKLKKDFILAKNHIKSVINDFENLHKVDIPLIDAYKGYSDDLCEMIYQHLDRMNENNNK